MKKKLGILILTASLMFTGLSASQAATYGSPFKVQTGGTYCPVYMRITSINFWDWLAGKRVGQLEFQYYAYC